MVNLLKDILFILLSFQFLQPVFLGIDFGTEFLPYATVFLVIAALIGLPFGGMKLLSKEKFFSTALLLFLIVYAAITSAIHGSFSVESAIITFSPLLCLYTTKGLSLKKDYTPTAKVFLVCWLCWVFTVCLQLAFPSVYDQISSLFFKRNNYELAERGLSGLATEPSFAAEVLMLFYATWKLNLNRYSAALSNLFISTFVPVVILNGSITMYGLLVMLVAVEAIVNVIYWYVRNPNRLTNLFLKPLRNKRLVASGIVLVLVALVIIGFGLPIPYRILSFFQSEWFNYTSSNSGVSGFLYDVSLGQFGSWRTVSNYVGYSIGVWHPVGSGLGSASNFENTAIFRDAIDRIFSGYNNDLGKWIVVSFTYGPYITADLGIIFLLLVLWYIFKVTKIKLLLNTNPTQASILVASIVCILLISPKGSLSPWFMMIYAASKKPSSIY